MARQICIYEFQTRKVVWNGSPCSEKAEKYPQEKGKIEEMEKLLHRLSLENPLPGNPILYPAYYGGEETAYG